MDSLPSGYQFLAEGGESKVFLSEDGRFVVKVNDAGYFATWTEYFNSLVLHNLLFSNSPYSLLGFIEIEEKLFAVVQQPFVEGDMRAFKQRADCDRELTAACVALKPAGARA